MNDMNTPPDSKDNSLPVVPSDSNLPDNIDRRTFIIRNAVIGAAAAMTGTVWTHEARAAQAAKEAAAKTATKTALDSTSISPDLDVVKRSKGPVMTVLDEFYKVGPGPSSSHTIGPMRITYDFYQRCTKLPADQLAQATGLKVHLYGSLSATGKGHGTERAAKSHEQEIQKIHARITASALCQYSKLSPAPGSAPWSVCGTRSNPIT